VGVENSREIVCCQYGIHSAKPIVEVKSRNVFLFTHYIYIYICVCFSLSAIGRVVYLSQIERDVKCKLQLWTMFISCKTISTKKTLVKLPSNVDVGSGCWTPSGWFVFCDSSMNVYRTQPGIPNAEMCIEHTEDDSRKQCALMCSTKHGFMLYTANHLTVSVFADVFVIITHYNFVPLSSASRTPRVFSREIGQSSLTTRCGVW